MGVVFCGILFRFTNLGTKDYWRDEAQTSLWISGHTQQAVGRELEVGSELSFQDLKKYQQINPERGIGDTLGALADEDPKHSPMDGDRERATFGALIETLSTR